MPLFWEEVLNPDWVKYGIEGAIFLAAMIVLFLLYFMTKKGNESFQEQMTKKQDAQDKALAERQREQDERAKQQDELYAKVLEFLARGQSHVHTTEEENKSSKFAAFVHLELENLVKETHCSRAYFVIYHNGVWSNNGISLPKMSMVNEAVGAYGIESIMPQLQSIPRGFLPGLDSLFAQDGKVFYKDIEEFREKDPMTYSWLASHGCKSFEMHPVKDLNKDYFIGFVGIEYYKEMPQDMTDKQIKIATARVADGIAAAACFTNEDEKLAAGSKTNKEGLHD